MAKNSQTPSAHSADVAVERNSTENNIDMASHTPPKAMATTRNPIPRATSTPRGGMPSNSRPAPSTISHSAISATESVASPPRNLPSSRASR